MPIRLQNIVLQPRTETNFDQRLVVLAFDVLFVVGTEKSRLPSDCLIDEQWVAAWKVATLAGRVGAVRCRKMDSAWTGAVS